MTAKGAPFPAERIERVILLIRGHKVMLAADLAALYGVETRALVQAVKRNLDRFPEDFMFQLTAEELGAWRSQIVMSKPGATKGLRQRPHAITEQGVAMLSSVLRSKQASRAATEAIRWHLTYVHIVHLPDGSDPDDLADEKLLSLSNPSCSPD